MATIKRIRKSVLSMYLRTKCDRELYLSLHEDKELEKHGLPVALQARPGIGVLQTAGRDFEDDRNTLLISLFGPAAIWKPDSKAKTKPAQEDLGQLLNRVQTVPSIIFQGKFDPKPFQKSTFEQIGLNATQAATIPDLSGLIPDLVLVRHSIVDEYEVLADGERKAINSSDSRLALSIFDIKHTSEANPSYCSEISLYALFLANWLKENNLDNRYYVASDCYLWTRLKLDQSKIDKLAASGSNYSSEDVVRALIEDSENANLRFYLPTVLNFFREDIPRVIAIGDQSPNGWQNLEWHVDQRCSACDWLGHEKWANTNDKAKIQNNPGHYCFTSARQSGHLCQLAGMTRGARKTLEVHSIDCVTKVASSAPNAPAFQEHTHLKREKNRLPQRANSLLTSTVTVDQAAMLASLAPAPNFYASIIVNFDASSGMLTGLSIVGQATTYTLGQQPKNFPVRTFVVDQKNLDEEWVALQGLLTTLSDMILSAEQFVRATNGITAQITFWEKRQFEELCAAIGRHLPKVLMLQDRKTRSLAWLFPAEELIERPDGAISPCVVFIDEIVRNVVFAPTPHVITLFDTVEVYYSGSGPVRMTDAYYREFLTNGIPRERIYEIWSNVSTITRGTVSLPRNTVISEYSNALEKQCRALNSITNRLRADFRGHLKSRAARLLISIPQGARGVAFDSKLWIWWEQLQFATRDLSSRLLLAQDAETLEANYEAMRLTNGRRILQDLYEFDILPGSTEAKFEEGDSFLTLGKDALPGLPFNRAQDILKPMAPAYTDDSELLTRPLWSTISAEINSLDLLNRKARVRLFHWREQTWFPYLVSNSQIDLLNDVFITKGISTFKWHDICSNILSSVGTPPIATPDLNAARTMAAVPPQRRGTDPTTPIASVLWNATALCSNSIVPQITAATIADSAEQTHNLNASQKVAVKNAIEQQMTIIWGPPGTGKTKTLAALVHSLTRALSGDRLGTNILIAGPTYKAVEELIERIIIAIANDASCLADIFIAYSSSQRPKSFSPPYTKGRLASFNLRDREQLADECYASLSDRNKITIVATASMQAWKFAERLTNNCVGQVFDTIIIDESSQVQVTTAISPLATLREQGRLVIAGDHLQMPPIMALEPPVGAEYLVGSIQRYLIERFQIVSCALEENYRSNEDIVAYARSIGYRSSLASVFPHISLHLIAPLDTAISSLPQGLPTSTLWKEILEPSRKVVTLLHDDDLSSQSSRSEAKIVAGLVWCLRNSVSGEIDGRGGGAHHPPTPKEFWEKCIGIVTPHRAQRALVVRELKRIFPSDPPELIDNAVDTVEKFQGGERHTILVTYGVGDGDVIAGEEAFLMQLERTNVAVSRAMAKCVVIMPFSLAGHVPQDKKALKTAHALKGYLFEFCNKEQDGQILFGQKGKKAKIRYR